MSLGLYDQYDFLPQYGGGKTHRKNGPPELLS